MKNLDKAVVLGLVRDLILSVSASLFALLLLRWVTAPIGGFTVLLFKWLGLSLVASGVAFITSKYYKRDRDVVSRGSLLNLVIAVFIKDVILAVCLMASRSLGGSPSHFHGYPLYAPDLPVRAHFPEQ